MSVRITDCTIRDGGYLLGKNSPREFVKEIMNGLVEAGIDFVETGFLQTKVTGESLVYADSIDARRFLPEMKGNTQFIGFCDNSRYSIDGLDEFDGKSFRWIRISFAKHEIDEAIKFCQGVQQKGYLVQFNPMDAISYSEEERTCLIARVNGIKPDCLSIVDTFGAMYLEDLKKIFDQIDALLDKDISIGLHSHDNLGLSSAMAEEIIDLGEKHDRDVIVDGSLLGMGRGAGNARTELLADFINKKHGGNYNIEVLIRLIEKCIIPLKEDILWGYDIPMFICGVTHSHVDNVFYIQNNMDVSMEEMYKIIQSLDSNQRIRYGRNYNKNDFSELRDKCDQIGNNR